MPKQQKPMTASKLMCSNGDDPWTATIFRAKCNTKDYNLWDVAKKDSNTFWDARAKELHWFSPYHTVESGSMPDVRWFEGGKINACYNCLDRHLGTSVEDKIALYFEAEDGKSHTVTYRMLYEKVTAFSSYLKAHGVQKHDTVAIYMPMIEEAIIAMLACARIGAIHTAIFAGFSSKALADRINDCKAKVVVCADGAKRKGAIIPLKRSVDEALASCPDVEKVLIFINTQDAITIHKGRDFFIPPLTQGTFAAEAMDAEDPLFILYTSGTTGKPKGIVHSTGGYMVSAHFTTKLVFDVKDSDILFCTADIGWITGHTYLVYGPLSCGMSVVLYEGAIDFPSKERLYEIIEKYKVTTLYTAPTAIRLLMKWGELLAQKHPMASLRLLGSVGEPINPEAWRWYHQYIGKGRCPVIDTWWQTETGSIMISAVAGLTPLRPGSATYPLPGIDVAILAENGQPEKYGDLAITKAWPSMLRGIFGDRKRYLQTYFSRWQEPYYFTGDGAMQDEDSYLWLTGRVDDVINISGHRLSTMELESAFVEHPCVAEAAAIAIHHDIKGQAVAAFITLKDGIEAYPDLEGILKEHIVSAIGAIARPERILFTYELPKTRSGKIMRRLLRDIAEGRILGDITTLTDPAVMEAIKEKMASATP